MLSFATEFPINRRCKSADFIEVVKAWILESPHTRFSHDELSGIPSQGEWSAHKETEHINALLVSSQNEESVAVQRIANERHIEWATTVVFSRQDADSWVGVRAARESSRPALTLPPAKKPIIIRTLLDDFGGISDGDLQIEKEPHRLGNDDVGLAARLISGRAGCYLPIVYVSCEFVGDYIVDANSLASDLFGMAHVVMEPNRPFSRRLQIDVNSTNVYGGTIGIYWPDGGGRRSFFIGREFENAFEIKRAIVDEIRSALLNRRPLPRCTWSVVQETLSRQRVSELRSSGSRELERYIELFDSEVKAKATQLADAESEIARLQTEIRRHESRVGVGAEVILRTGSEQDLYAGELSEIVRDAIEDAADRVQSDSRREHVFRAILNANESDEIAREKREELKSLLRSYTHMDKGTRKGLENIGFSITEDGKHYKIVFRDDDRYTFALPKSGSDRRGGLNAASDISKRLF